MIQNSTLKDEITLLFVLIDFFLLLLIHFFFYFPPDASAWQMQ